MNAKLMQHQIQGVEFAIKTNGVCAFHYEVGCGKTLTSLATYSYFKAKEPQLKLLVICPISLIHGAWVKEIEKFTEYDWVDLHQEKYPPDSRNPKNIDICLVNFESLISWKKFEALHTAILNSNSPWMVVIDESSKMKNHQSKTVSRLNGDWEKGKYIQGIRDLCKYRIELTGTPAPNDFFEYWSQMYFLHPHILGENFYKFRNQYYHMRRGKEIIPGAVFGKTALREMFNNGYKYEFNAAMHDEFFGRLKPWCHMVKAKDCLDLPEYVDEYRMVDMAEDQKRVYKEMKTQFVAEIRKELQDIRIGLPTEQAPLTPTIVVIANLVLTKMMKLRQITSGFAIDETGTAHAVTTKINPKIQALRDIVEECGNEQIIIWAQFRWEIALITNILKEVSGEGNKMAGVSELHGGVPEKDRIVHIDNFINGKNRFLVAHPDSAAHGLTFVNCCYSVYFSLSYSFEEYSQSRGRIMRHGQSRNCVYFHILASGTVDEEILAVCQKKKTKQDIAEEFLK